MAQHPQSICVKYDASHPCYCTLRADAPVLLKKVKVDRSSVGKLDESVYDSQAMEMLWYLINIDGVTSVEFDGFKMSFELEKSSDFSRVVSEAVRSIEEYFSRGRIRVSCDTTGLR